jgi:RND family efflux transporter MFP subunit
MKVRLKHALLVFGGMLLCVAAGSFFVTHRVRAIAPKNASPEIPHAAVALVKRGPISNSVSIAGEFLPYQEVELHGKVAGYIRKINVDIGDHVRTGQVLALLEVPELNAQVSGAEAGVRHSQEEITRAKNQVKRAEASHAALHAAAARLQQASATRPGLVAQQELDDAEAKDLGAEAQVDAAKSALAAAEQQLEMSRATDSQVSAMQDYSRIVAPFDGVVTWRYADTGALIQAGTANSNSMPVVKLAQINPLRLRLPVPEQIAPSVHIGQEADIRVQATGEHFTGKLTRLTDSLDRSTRTMQVEIDVPNETYRLAPGMYADVSLAVEKRPDTLTVPVQAVSQEGDRASVLVLDAQNRVQVREIQTGIQSASCVEVLSGLHEGERIILGNLSEYQPGEMVKPTEDGVADAELASGGGAH